MTKKPLYSLPSRLKTPRRTPRRIPININDEGLLMADNLSHPYHRRRVLTIDDLADDDLLEIFDFYVVKYQHLGFYQLYEPSMKREIESWQSLVHVCRRWRGLVFRSPRRLNLQICYHTRDRIRSSIKALDIWPALPLFIFGDVSKTSVDSAIARLKRNDRICHIDLLFDEWLQKFWTTAMQVPFPELTALSLRALPQGPRQSLSAVPVLSDSFLRGSAPRLRYLYLRGIPFPGLPKLLLSATHLVDIHLRDIPRSGYISPEMMATCLSMLTSLKTLRLEFNSPHFHHPDLKCRRPFPPTRSVLPTLTILGFNGRKNEYFEEFVARIDTPRLYRLLMEFHSDIDPDTPELVEFISRTPTLAAYDEARIIFELGRTQIRLSQSHPEPSDHTVVEATFLCGKSDRQVSSLVPICTSSFRLLLTMEDLYIGGSRFLIDCCTWWELEGWGDSETTECLDLLRPFTAVKRLYLSESFSQHIALALQGLTGGRTNEVLPALEHVILVRFRSSILSVQNDFANGFAKFISARQLNNHPVTLEVLEVDD